MAVALALGSGRAQGNPVAGPPRTQGNPVAGPPRAPDNPIAGSPAPPPARDAIGLHLVPATAAAAMRADLDEVEGAAALVRSLGGEIGLAANLISLASATSLGFDLLARAGWRSVGIETDQPVLVVLGRAVPDAAPALWHVRVIARVADPKRFADWAEHNPLLGEPWRASRSGRGALAPILGLGADPRAEADAARALIARGTIAAGAVVPAVGTLLLVRRVGAQAVLDAFAPADTGRLTWARDGAWILSQLDPPAAGTSLGDRTSPAALALARPGLTFWTQPAALFDAALLWTRPPTTCAVFRDLAPHTALTDGAASLRVGSHQLSLDLVWSAAAGARLAEAWPVADDGLVGPPLRGGAVLAASLHLGATDRLAALPRSSPIDGGWVPLWRQVRSCGRTARSLLLAFAWPELAAQWLRDVAAVAPAAARLVGSVRNLGFAARRVAAHDRHRWQAVLEASLTAAGEEPATAILDAVFGGRHTARRPRPHIAWAGQYLHPYALSRGNRGRIVGVAIGDGARRWRLQQPLIRARRGPAPVPLARATGNTAAILRQLGPGLPPHLRSLAAAAAPRVGSVEATLTIQPDSVRTAVTLRWH